MTVHTLKTWPEQFQAVCRGEKTFLSLLPYQGGA